MPSHINPDLIRAINDYAAELGQDPNGGGNFQNNNSDNQFQQAISPLAVQQNFDNNSNFNNNIYNPPMTTIKKEDVLLERSKTNSSSSEMIDLTQVENNNNNNNSRTAGIFSMVKPTEPSLTEQPDQESAVFIPSVQTIIQKINHKEDVQQHHTRNTLKKLPKVSADGFTSGLKFDQNKFRSTLDHTHRASVEQKLQQTRNQAERKYDSNSKMNRREKDRDKDKRNKNNSGYSAGSGVSASKRPRHWSWKPPGDNRIQFVYRSNEFLQNLNTTLNLPSKTDIIKGLVDGPVSSMPRLEKSQSSPDLSTEDLSAQPQKINQISKRPEKINATTSQFLSKKSTAENLNNSLNLSRPLSFHHDMDYKLLNLSADLRNKPLDNTTSKDLLPDLREVVSCERDQNGAVENNNAVLEQLDVRRRSRKMEENFIKPSQNDIHINDFLKTPPTTLHRRKKK